MNSYRTNAAAAARPSATGFGIPRILPPDRADGWLARVSGGVLSAMPIRPSRHCRVLPHLPLAAEPPGPFLPLVGLHHFAAAEMVGATLRLDRRDRQLVVGVDPRAAREWCALIHGDVQLVILRWVPHRRCVHRPVIRPHPVDLL